LSKRYFRILKVVGLEVAAFLAKAVTGRQPSRIT